ncbi:MAG: DNA glycosylase AlkZ-like family protein [Egibacteraceae bacterium]
MTRVGASGEGRVLDRRTLNRTLLARQLLLERVEMPVAGAIEHLVALQAQNPLDPYVALWSRLYDFDPHELGQLMLDRLAVRMTLLRTTLHLVTARDALALRPVVQGMIERRFHTGTPFGRNLSGIDLDALLAAGIELVEEQPLGASDLSRRLVERFPGYDASSLGAAIAAPGPARRLAGPGLFARVRGRDGRRDARRTGRRPPDTAQQQAVCQVLEDCQQRLVRYRAALEAGAEPALVAQWIAENQAERAAAQARLHQHEGQRRLSREEISSLVAALGDLVEVIQQSDPADKAEIYRQLGLHPVYDPDKRKVRAGSRLSPHLIGLRFVSVGGLEPPSPYEDTALNKFKT